MPLLSRDLLTLQGHRFVLPIDEMEIDPHHPRVHESVEVLGHIDVQPVQHLPAFGPRIGHVVVLVKRYGVGDIPHELDGTVHTQRYSRVSLR